MQKDSWKISLPLLNNLIVEEFDWRNGEMFLEEQPKEHLQPFLHQKEFLLHPTQREGGRMGGEWKTRRSRRRFQGMALEDAMQRLAEEDALKHICQANP